LKHSSELEELARQAQTATLARDPRTARDLWSRAIELLPPDTVQYRSIQARIDGLNAQAATPPPAHGAPWKKGAAGLGSTLLLLLGKGKLLLLGLTKLTTLVSMFAFFAVYWALYGWPFAMGLVLSIYVHEMGHVLSLRGYGIPATAPMFIPGLGAFIRMRALSIDPIQESRVGLAGPLYGLGAAICSLGVYLATGSKIWEAIANAGAVLNLFNLIPVWQLDGSRGLRSLTRQQRGMLLVLAIAIWAVTHQPMLFLIAIGLAYRLFTKDAPAEGDNTGLLEYAGLLVALSTVITLARLR
jgi:Zn-dependent protease